MLGNASEIVIDPELGFAHFESAMGGMSDRYIMLPWLSNSDPCQVYEDEYLQTCSNTESNYSSVYYDYNVSAIRLVRTVISE